MRQTIAILLFILANQLHAQMPNTLSNSDKVFGLSRFWQEVNYNFVYLDKVNRELWDAEYKRLIADVQKTSNDYDYYRLLQKFCALLKDGHTNVNFPKAVRDQLSRTDFGDYRLFLTNINGKAIVTRVNASKKDKIPIGTEVITVNGLKTDQYLKTQVVPYISSSTDYIVEDRAVQNMFYAPIGTRFDIKFRLPDGIVTSYQLTAAKTTEKEVFPPFENRDLMDFKWINREIAYIALNSFNNPEINSLFVEKLPEIYKASKLIVDLRYNGGGSTGIGREILEYLTHDTLLFGSKQVSRLHIPSFKAWGRFTEAKDTVGSAWATQAYLSYRDQFYHVFPYQPDTVKRKSKRIVVPTVLLIGHNTASAAEDFLILADNQNHMIKIGEPTFGSTGQPFFFDLPGGAPARVCTKKDTYPDGREFVGYGIQPDITVVKTLEDYLNERDPALEKAVKYLKELKS